MRVISCRFRRQRRNKSVERHFVGVMLVIVIYGLLLTAGPQGQLAATPASVCCCCCCYRDMRLGARIISLILSISRQMTSASSQSTAPACRRYGIIGQITGHGACRRTGNQLVISVSNARSLYGSRDAASSVWRASGPAIGEHSSFGGEGQTQSGLPGTTATPRIPRDCGKMWCLARALE